MIFDFEMVRSFYQGLPAIQQRVREQMSAPLTLSEKILYAHLNGGIANTNYRRGMDYVEFAPDRVAMQDATAQMALLQFMMAGKKQTAIPTTVHCDHLIVARSGATPDLEEAKVANSEVYNFLSSVCNRYGIGFWEPGSGIIHQIVLENYAFPGGMMIGTDSHTVNAGGLGMIAIGVGGADAVDVMAGMGWELKFPRIIGVRLTGRLRGWASAKDVILKLAGLLTVKGGSGCIIEYFGEGAESLSCTGKATICNMGAEVGATCSIFGYDKSMSEYLACTGRREIAVMADGVWEHLTADPEVLSNPERYYDQIIEIDLSALEPHINGPFSPDVATPISGMKAMAQRYSWPTKVDVGLIGSCTNSSYEDISRAASVVRDAISKKLKPKAEFAVTPGSERIRAIAQKDGHLAVLEGIGAKVFANACGPCIGQWARVNANAERANTIVHSFNRNFAKRADGNPNTHAFVASPEIVAALAIAGDLTFNPLTDTLLNADGEKVMLAEPTGSPLPPNGFTKGSPVIKVSGGSQNAPVKVNPASERLQLLTPFPKWDGIDMLGLVLLIKAKGKCTTDHISMAGPWLKYRGHLENISNNYMAGATNFFNGLANSVFNPISGEYEPVPQVARAIKALGQGMIVVGEENFGEGSSREHAAMEPRFLNVRVVLVKSFARIHETNLKKQGVLALTFANPHDYDRIQEHDVVDVLRLNTFTPGEPIEVILRHADGSVETIYANHSYNSAQIEWFKAGSALNLIREKNT
jgi:aconitate hydratase